MKKQHLFFDLDGVLMNGIYTWFPEVPDLLKQLQANGHRCYVCTGRGDSAIPEELSKIFDAMITLSGARCINSHNEIILNQIIDHDIRDIILKHCRDNNICVFLENENGCVSLFPCDGTDEDENEFVDYCWKKYDGFDNFLANNDEEFHKINFRKRHLEKMIPPEKLTDLDLKYIDAGGGWIEMPRIGSSKGHAIRVLMEHDDASLNNTVCFGDSENDMEMFETCRHRVAVGNASDSLKQKSTLITADADQQGVLKACKRLNLI